MRATALRELLEETGIHLQNPPSVPGKQITAPSREDIQKARGQLRTHPSHYRRLTDEMQWPPPRQDILHYCTFVTPTFEKRQYETHFYLAEVSEEECETMSADGEETAALMWLNPAEAVSMQQNAQISFLPPQYYIFNDFSKNKDIDDLLGRIKKGAKAEGGKGLDARGYPAMRPERLSPAFSESEPSSLTLTLPFDEAHTEWPGRPGQTHRIICGLPMGSSSFCLEKVGMEEFA